MVETIKRERPQSEEPVLPLTPDSNSGNGMGVRSFTEEKKKNHSSSSPSPTKRPKGNKATAARSKVRFHREILCLILDLICFRLLLLEGYHALLTELSHRLMVLETIHDPIQL